MQSGIWDAMLGNPSADRSLDLIYPAVKGSWDLKGQLTIFPGLKYRGLGLRVLLTVAVRLSIISHLAEPTSPKREARLASGTL